jgi:hypothetical protein
MKLLLFCLLLPSLVLAQHINTASGDTLIKEELLQKMKRQKTIALATGITGVVLALTGSIMFLSQFGEGLTAGSTSYNENTSKTGETLAYIGGGLMVVSVPFSLAYRRNKKVLASLSLQHKMSPLLNGNPLARHLLPAVSLRLRFGQ